jgi:hypothetical protein
MSMAQSFQPELPTQDDGIPAADAGNGAPPPAEGFGVGREEPDTPEHAADDSSAPSPTDTLFRTPDPNEVGRHAQPD